MGSRKRDGQRVCSPRESVLCWFSVLGILEVLAQDSWCPVKDSLLPGLPERSSCFWNHWALVQSCLSSSVSLPRDPLAASLPSRPGVFFFAYSGRLAPYSQRGQASLMPCGHGDNSWTEDAKPGQRTPSPPVCTVCSSLPYGGPAQPDEGPTRAGD